MNPQLFCSRGAFSIFAVYLVVLVLLIASTSFVVSAQDAPYIIHTYHADISPLSDMYDVSGYVVLFTKSDTDESSTYLGYAGMVDNIESNLTYATCTAVNGCGVHVHSGKSCFNSTTQGGHYYNNETIDVDPWIEARYFTNDDGMSSSFSGLLDIGSTDIDGRAFIVHSENGTRIGCGIIEKVSGEGVLSAVTTELTASGVTSQVSLHTLGEGVVCYFGLATSLERDLVSYLNPDPFLGGMDCNFTNGCGVHLHNGTACTDKTTQGGHFYGADVEIDPWLYTMYYSTDQNGEAYYTGCVDTGISDESSFTDRPFIVHSNNGSRVSCGLLQASTVVSPTAPTPAMPTAPTPTMPSTSHASAVVTTVNVGLILTAVVSCMLM